MSNTGVLQAPRDAAGVPFRIGDCVFLPSTSLDRRRTVRTVGRRNDGARAACDGGTTLRGVRLVPPLVGAAGYYPVRQATGDGDETLSRV